MKLNISNDISVATLRKVMNLADDIENKQAQIRALLSGESRKPLKAGRKTGTKKSGRFTDAQRAKISEGLKAKWAERKAAKAVVKVAPPVPMGGPFPSTSVSA